MKQGPKETFLQSKSRNNHNQWYLFGPAPKSMDELKKGKERRLIA